VGLIVYASRDYMRKLNIDAFLFSADGDYNFSPEMAESKIANLIEEIA
jgi:hypothetical protein